MIALLRESPKKLLQYTKGFWMCLFFTFLLACEKHDVACADEGNLVAAPSFESLLVEALSKRAELVSGEFEYEISKTLDGKIQVKTKGIYAYDERLEETFHAFRIQTEDDLKKKKPASLAGGCVHRSAPRKSLLFSVKAPWGIYVTLESETRKSEVKPFDFRSFGYAMFGDFDRKSPFDTTLMHYMAYRKESITALSPATRKDPKLRETGVFTYDLGGITMSIESEKDVWPIHASYQRPGIRVGEDGKSYATDDVVTLSKCEIELTEFDDVWLPKKVTYTAGEHVVDISIIWKSINPVPEKLVMTDERLMQLVEKPMRQ